MRYSSLLGYSVVLMLTACSTSTPPATPPPPQQQTSSASSASSVASDISVAQPQPNATITSPLTITGEARGSWYFEATFPVKLLDGNNIVIATGKAEAQSDWMTTNFVPFKATLTFTTPASPTGTLVLEKDNPSGEPQNAASVSIPVTF